MKTVVLAAALATLGLTAPALADEATTAAAPAAKFTLDTPIETLVADNGAKAVIEADLPGLTNHPQYDQFKGMSLTVLSSFAPDRLTPERLAKVKDDLAKLK